MQAEGKNGPSEMYVPGLTERVERLERLIQETRREMEKSQGGSGPKHPMPAGWMR
jgi:hypothetical protein